MSVVSKGNAWLVPRGGAGGGERSSLERAVTCVGRAPSNDIVLKGGEAATVSSHHLEIRREVDRYRLIDRDSTNGTYVNGVRVSDTLLEAGSVIRLGPNGPEFSFEVEPADAPAMDETRVLPALDTEIAGFGETPPPAAQPTTPDEPAPLDDTHEELVAEAVHQMRSARQRGESGQTVIIMRETLRTGIRQSSRRLKWIVGGLIGFVVVAGAYGGWAIRDLRQQKSDIDAQIVEIETRLEQGGQDAQQIDRLIARLRQYQERARALQDNLLYQFTPEGRERIFVQREIETLLAEFGATEYNVPPEFVENVHQHIERYQGPDRPHMERALGRARDQLDRMRELFEQDRLPGDLAYMVLVESAFINGRTSQAEAAGLWQFRTETARQFGLTVNEEIDERLDPDKSTHAAARYIRSLILEFGSGNSVMLALAAYNTGPTRVRRAVRRVDDPINQRNFWHLYSTEALPRETREYVPRIFAAIIVGRNPEQFGF